MRESPLPTPSSAANRSATTLAFGQVVPSQTSGDISLTVAAQPSHHRGLNSRGANAARDAFIAARWGGHYPSQSEQHGELTRCEGPTLALALPALFYLQSCGNLLREQLKTLPRLDMFRTVQSSTVLNSSQYLTPHMRAVLVDWMVEVGAGSLLARRSSSGASIFFPSKTAGWRSIGPLYRGVPCCLPLAARCCLDEVDVLMPAGLALLYDGAAHLPSVHVLCTYVPPPPVQERATVITLQRHVLITSSFPP